MADTLGRRESQPSSLATCRDLTYLSSRPAHVCLLVCRPSVSPSRVETSPKQRLPLRSLLSGVSMCLSCELMNIAQDVSDINKRGLSPRHSARSLHTGSRSFLMQPYEGDSTVLLISVHGQTILMLSMRNVLVSYCRVTNDHRGRSQQRTFIIS